MSYTDRKQNIVVILPSLAHSFEYTFSLGVRSVLPIERYNLIYVATGWLEEAATDPLFVNRFHSELQFKDLDGVVIYGSAISGKYPPKSILSITNCYGRIPTVNAGHVVEGLPSIVVDNKGPFKAFVHYLVHQKKCTDIAFIKGPKENFDARERYSAFLEAMEECSLQVADELVWPGNFRVSSGVQGLRDFIKRHKRVPRAIICVNDITAIGVENEAIRQGYSVPEDLMVIGFDDWEYTLNVQVPLSTSRYPMYEMGQASGRAIVDWLKGDVPASIIRVDSQVVYRASTGDHGLSTPHVTMRLSADRHYAPRYSNYERLLISREINKSDNLVSAFEHILSNVNDQGVNLFYFFQLDGESAQSSVNRIIEISTQQVSTLPKDHLLYQYVDVEKLLSEVNFSDSMWIISPVLTSELCFGYLLMSSQSGDLDFCEFLANEIAKKIENIRLTKSATELRNQVLQAEKMASLGRMVSGVAHEINTPLGVSLLAASNLNEEIKLIQRKVEDGEMTLSSFTNFLATCEETYQILFGSLRRSAELVSSFKKVSVDHEVDELRYVNLAEYIEEVLLSLKPRLKKTTIQLTTDLENGICMETHPGTWAQLVNNLVLNAVIHAFQGSAKQSTIHIQLYQKDGSVYLLVKDNGKGISESTLPLIFDPFFTTERGRGGTGLGLHVVYNMVTQKLNGTIYVASLDEKVDSNESGTTFTIRVPIKIEKTNMTR